MGRVALAARFSIPWQAVEQVDALTEKQQSLVVLLAAERSADAERPRRESRGRHSIFRSSEKYHVDLGIPKYIRVVCNRVLPVMTVEFPLDLDLDLHVHMYR